MINWWINFRKARRMVVDTAVLARYNDVRDILAEMVARAEQKAARTGAWEDVTSALALLFIYYQKHAETQILRTSILKRYNGGQN